MEEEGGHSMEPGQSYKVPGVIARAIDGAGLVSSMLLYCLQGRVSDGMQVSQDTAMLPWLCNL